MNTIKIIAYTDIMIMNDNKLNCIIEGNDSINEYLLWVWNY